MLMFEHLPSKAIPVKDKLAEKRTCQAPDRVQVEILSKFIGTVLILVFRIQTQSLEKA